MLRVAEIIAAHNENLGTLSNRQTSNEEQRRKAKIGTTSVLSILSQLIREQIQFGKDIADICPEWSSLSPDAAIPPFVLRRLRRWHRNFPLKVDQLTEAATSLFELTQQYKASACRLAGDIQIFHRDGILAIDCELKKIHTASENEKERLIQKGNVLVAAVATLKQTNNALEWDRAVLGRKLENYKPDPAGRGFSLAGVGFGAASLGLLAVCPPLGAATGVISFVSSMTGLGITNSSISKSKKLQENAKEISQRATQLNFDLLKLRQEGDEFAKQSQAAQALYQSAELLHDKVNIIISAAEALERISVQQHSTSSAIGLRVSGIRSSSTALKMVATHDHLINCVETILSDFSYSLHDHQLQVDWGLTSNLPPDTHDCTHWPVRLEQINLSQDYTRLIGTVAVANLGFEKCVTARYTRDNWATVSEIVAEYNSELRWKGEIDGLDRFSFSISLATQPNLNERPVCFCVKYRVNDQEYWDNNNRQNFQVKLKEDDIALCKVLDELATGLVELKVYENMMHGLEAIEEREYFQDV